MNEKLYELLDNIQRTAVQASDVAADADYGVSKKAGELLTVAKLESIDALKTQIADLNAQIGREQAAAACPTCGAAIQEGDQFCRECGGKL